jgi:hypothetical protein
MTYSSCFFQSNAAFLRRKANHNACSKINVFHSLTPYLSIVDNKQITLQQRAVPRATEPSYEAKNGTTAEEPSIS